MYNTYFTLRLEDAPQTWTKCATPTNNHNTLNPVTSYRQFYYRIQNIPYNTTSTDLIREGTFSQKKLQNASKKTQALQKLFLNLQDQLSSASNKHPPKQHRRRTHRRRKKAKKRHSTSSSDTTESSENYSTGSESS